MRLLGVLSVFFFNEPSPAEIYTMLPTLSLHFSLPIYAPGRSVVDSTDLYGRRRELWMAAGQWRDGDGLRQWAGGLRYIRGDLAARLHANDDHGFGRRMAVDGERAAQAGTTLFNYAKRDPSDTPRKQNARGKHRPAK